MAAITACIFDLDGTLIDSEPNYLASDRAFLADYGIDYDEKFNAQMTGRGLAEFFGALEEAFPSSPFHALPLAERIERKDTAYLRYLRGRTHAFPAMRGLVEELSHRGVPMAVASSSSPAVISACLAETGLGPRFTAVASGLEVRRGKPAPDVFLEAARRLDVPPANCLVFEDARPGVEAAIAAGMRCVVLPVSGSTIDDRFRKADLVIEGGPGSLDLEELLVRLRGAGLGID